MEFGVPTVNNSWTGLVGELQRQVRQIEPRCLLASLKMEASITCMYFISLFEIAVYSSFYMYIYTKPQAMKQYFLHLEPQVPASNTQTITRNRLSLK